MPRAWTETSHYKSVIDGIEAELVGRGFVKVPLMSKLKKGQYYRQDTIRPGATDGSEGTTYRITWQLATGERRR